MTVLSTRTLLEVVAIVLVFVLCLIGIALWANGVMWGAALWAVSVLAGVVLHKFVQERVHQDELP